VRCMPPSLSLWRVERPSLLYLEQRTYVHLPFWLLLGAAHPITGRAARRQGRVGSRSVNLRRAYFCLGV
jgi:hypothetical protein